MKRNYKSEAFRVIHESAEAKFKAGIISKERMGEFDRGCLVPEVPRLSFQARTAASCCPALAERLRAEIKAYKRV